MKKNPSTPQNGLDRPARTPAHQAEAKDVDTPPRALMEEVTLTPDERELCRRAAEGRGLDLAGWVRDTLVRAAKEDAKLYNSMSAAKRKQARQDALLPKPWRNYDDAPAAAEGELEAWVYFSTKNGDQVRMQAFPHADITEKPKQHTFYLRKCSRPECGCNEIADRLLSVYAAAAVLHAMAVAGAKFTGELGKILHGPDAEKRGYPAPDRGIAIFAGGRGYSEIAADAGVSLNFLVDLYGNAVFLLETPLRWPRWAREVLPPKPTPKRNE